MEMTLQNFAVAPEAHDSIVDVPVAVERAGPYVSRLLLQHLVDDPTSRCWTDQGTAAFVDISGFTKLSESLARKGREGAEHVAEVVGHIFESMLSVAYANGGTLVKFGGDALLLWFGGERHASCACRAAVAMRGVLREVGAVALPDGRIALQMAQGVHTGQFDFFAVGRSHWELLAMGSAWSRLVRMQQGAAADEIVVSPETAAALPGECVGAAKGPGLLLLGEPPGPWRALPCLRGRRCRPKHWRDACRRRSARTCSPGVAHRSTGP